jgi:hypothetical protein
MAEAVVSSVREVAELESSDADLKRRLTVVQILNCARRDAAR